MSRPVTASHSCVPPPSVRVRTRRPAASKLADQTSAPARRTGPGRPVAAAQMRAVRSLLVVTTRSPRGSKATPLTAPACGSAASRRRARRSHRTAPPAPAVTARAPSAVTSRSCSARSSLRRIPSHVVAATARRSACSPSAVRRTAAARSARSSPSSGSVRVAASARAASSRERAISARSTAWPRWTSATIPSPIGDQQRDRDRRQGRALPPRRLAPARADELDLLERGRLAGGALGGLPALGFAQVAPAQEMAGVAVGADPVPRAHEQAGMLGEAGLVGRDRGDQRREAMRFVLRLAQRDPVRPGERVRHVLDLAAQHRDEPLVEAHRDVELPAADLRGQRLGTQDEDHRARRLDPAADRRPPVRGAATDVLQVDPDVEPLGLEPGTERRRGPTSASTRE